MKRLCKQLPKCLSRANDDQAAAAYTLINRTESSAGCVCLNPKLALRKSAQQSESVSHSACYRDACLYSQLLTAHADLQDARISMFERLQRLAAAPLSFGKKCAAAALNSGCCCWASSKVLVSYCFIYCTTQYALHTLRISRVLYILVLKNVLTHTYTVDIDQYCVDIIKRPCSHINMLNSTLQRFDATMHLVPVVHSHDVR